MVVPNEPDKEWEDIVRRLRGSTDEAESAPVAKPHTFSPSAMQGPRDYTVAEEVVEEFQPPKPQPIATGNPRVLLSWTGVIGSVVVWLLAALLGMPLSWWLASLTIGAFLAGALSLFFLLPRTREHLDQHGDGDYGDGAKL